MKNLYLFLLVFLISVTSFAQTVAPITGVFTICSGAFNTISDATPGGVWSSSSSDTAEVYTSGTPPTSYLFGISAGVATISYTVGTISSTVTVTVNPLPAPVIGVSSLCTGATGSFTDATIGGTWITPSPMIATVGSSTGIVTGLAGGHVPIFYSLPTGCNSSLFLTVNPTPTLFSGPNNVCAGSTIIENAFPYGGFWSTSNTVVATTASVDTFTGVVAGVLPGIAVITYSLGTSCTATIVVTVTTASCSGTPTAGTASVSDSLVCIGSPVTLGLSGASGGCGIGYQWQYSPDGTTWTDLSGAITNSLSYTPAASQFYRCKVSCSSSGLFSYSGLVHVIVHSIIVADSVRNPIDTACNNLDFFISASGTSASLNVTTWYGDGTSINLPLTSSSICHADFFHTYSLPGTYQVKQVLYIGSAPQDSILFNYEYLQCRFLPIKFYFDANSDCVFDSGDMQILLPVLTEIDSNGIPIDTISATSGFYYKALGVPGTIYSFKVISTPGGLHVTCPSSATMYDTIQSFVNDYQNKYFGINCLTSTSFDLAEYITTRTGRHQQTGTIMVDNTFCTPESATVTLTFSPQYVFSSASPSPTSVVGNVAIWNLSAVSSSYPASPSISYTLFVPTPGVYSTWLIPGDTINSAFVTSPTIGDIDTSNNTIIRNDTVKASYDPNEMSVLPKGNIPACTRLQYTVNFENTGNDTAHNIFVMDTLSDNLDPHSLNIEIASSVMNIAIINDGVHNIAKFDFPGINLLDSTHHNQCDGMVIFNIKTRAGLATGTSIVNYAGIFFDDNPAVMTDTTVNQIGLPAITGPGNVCMGASITLTSPAGFSGGVWSSGSAAIATIGTSGVVSGVSASTATIIYTLTNSCGATSTTTPVIVKPLPTPYAVTGGGGYCAGSSGTHIGLDSSTVGTDYVLYNGTSSAGTFSGTGAALDFGLFTVTGTYTVVATNTATTCTGNMPDSAIIYVAPAVIPSVSIGAGSGDTVCAGSSATFTPVPVNGGTAPAYMWNIDGVNVSTGSAYTFVPADGDVVTLTLTSSALCATPETTSSSVTMYVENALSPYLSIGILPGTAISTGELVTLSASVTGGGAANAYQWVLNSTFIPGATTTIYSSNALADNDSVSCIVTTGNVCGSVNAARSVIFTVSSLGIKTLVSGDQLSIFPNPNKGEFIITGSLGLSSEEVNIAITDIIGQVIYANTTMAINGKINEKVHLSKTIAKGMYMLNLRSETQSKVFHFVVE